MRIFVLSLLLIACTRPAPTVLDAGPRPPIARRTPVTTTLHGDTRIDEYAWMKAYSPYDAKSLTWLLAQWGISQ